MMSVFFGYSSHLAQSVIFIVHVYTCILYVYIYIYYIYIRSMRKIK